MATGGEALPYVWASIVLDKVGTWPTGVAPCEGEYHTVNAALEVGSSSAPSSTSGCLLLLVT